MCSSLTVYWSGLKSFVKNCLCQSRMSLELGLCLKCCCYVFVFDLILNGIHELMIVFTWKLMILLLTWMKRWSGWNISREGRWLPGRINGGCQTDAIHHTLVLYFYNWGVFLVLWQFYCISLSFFFFKSIFGGFFWW